MKRLEQSVLLAGLLAIGLTACTRDRMGTTESATASVPAAQQSVTTDAYGMPVTSGTAMGASGTAGATGTPGSQAQAQPPTDPTEQRMEQATGTAAPNSVVTLIEVVPRPPGMVTEGAVGGTGAAGTTGTPDRMYRITLRMDDGSTQVVMQDWAPTFRSGDRVNLTGGEIQRR